MIPVSLKLQNFLSYGTAAPPLDFDSFHVACLSGRNGQGKSALLDAITWALWGEARKSSDSRKPDDELIRIGTRQMEVELVFEIEDERYRVVRSYTRSATGKTSKPGLEVHVYEPATSDYRPLTGASVRETQTHLDRLLGLDYDTFINSAFLLQGRSDEFTKKKPSERKAILAQILNLSRYDRLAELAAERMRDATAKVEGAEREIERLQQALEGEEEWKEQRKALDVQIADEETRRHEARKEEERLAGRLAALEAQQREAERMRRALADLDGRRREREAEAAALHKRIREAEVLLAEREAIERDYSRYQALLAERKDLDGKRDLYRAIEKQLEAKERERADRQNEAEKRLHALDVDVRADRVVLAECEAALAEMPSVQRRLGAAKAAEARQRAMAETLERRKGLDEERRQAEQALHGEAEALRGRLRSLEEQVEQTTRARPALEELQEKHQEKDRERALLVELREQLEKEIEEGKRCAEELKERGGLLQALKEELDKKQKRFEQFQHTDADVCPTCGTELTPDHRAEVEAELRGEIEALEARVERGRGWIAEKQAVRERLRTAYVAKKDQIDKLKRAPEEQAVLKQKIDAYNEEQKKLEALHTDVGRLRGQLAEEAFGEPHRRRLAAIAEQLAALPFDAEAYEAARHEAAQVARYAERLRDLEAQAGRKEQIEGRLGPKTREADALRAALADGSCLGEIPARIEEIKGQLLRVGFSPARFDEVRRGIEKLERAGERVKDLVHAQQNHAAWKEQLGAVQQRLAKLCEEREGQATALAAAEAALQGAEDLAEAKRRQTSVCEGIEEGLRALQMRKGELTTRLEQARQDREALRLRRREGAESKRERALYKHLRTAFGKHGIPSLIIEQTLPDIEDRANALLDRLSDGKMHVQLQTLKDKKTGGTKETLEIIITDEQGVPRPYETFSGGEAFRVNFALRLALAQLLAERSGVRIRTLVVDEGFGTQDAQGIESLIEAIQTVQDDFDKIVVITHLSRLKEAFPVRIEVEKDPVEGSKFEMIGV